MGIIKKMNKLNQRDPFVKMWMSAIQTALDEQKGLTEQTGKDIFFDTCSEAVLAIYEREAGLNAGSSLLEDRRSAVIAKWVASNVPSLEMVQKIADSWSYGKTECAYDNLTITVSFVDKGIPTGLEELKAAIEEAIPAHLAVNYAFKFNTWRDVSEITWETASAQTWEDILTR